MTGVTPNLLQAIEALRRADYTMARALCDQALASNRKDVDALDILAEVERSSGRSQVAVELMKQAVRLAPKNARLRVNLGRNLARTNQLRPAVTQFDEALKREPGLPIALAEKAAAYEALDRYDRIARTLKPALAGGATPAAVAAVHMRWLLHEKQNEAAVEFARAVLDHGHPSGPGLRHTAFELVRALERLERYDEAWAAAEIANGIGVVPYDAAGYARLVDRLTTTFSRTRLETMPRGNARALRPILVFGMPRTGTSLVERILDAHRNVTGIGENAILHVIARTMNELIGTEASYPECVDAMTANDATSLGDTYHQEAARHAPKTSCVVDKSLENHLHVGLANLILPDACFVHCRRDPLDTSVSCYLGRLPAAQHAYSTDLTDLGQHHAQYDRLLAHWRSALPAVMFELDYERLVTEPEPTIRALLDACGLPFDDACLAPHESSAKTRTLSFEQVREPIHTGSVGRSKRFERHLEPLKQALEGAPTS